MNEATAPSRPPRACTTRILIGLGIGFTVGIAKGAQAPHLREPALAITVPIGRLGLDAQMVLLAGPSRSRPAQNKEAPHAL